MVRPLILPPRQGNLLGHDRMLPDLLPLRITLIDLPRDHTITILLQQQIKSHWSMLHSGTLRLRMLPGRHRRDEVHPETANLIIVRTGLDLTNGLLRDQGPLATVQICQAQLR